MEEGLFCLLFLLTGHTWSARPHGWKSEFPHAAAGSAPLNADLPGCVPVLQLACHYGLQLLANSEHCWSLRLQLKADVSTSPPHKWLHPIPANVSVRMASSLGCGRSKVPQFVSVLGNNGTSRRQQRRFEDDQFWKLWIIYLKINLTPCHQHICNIGAPSLWQQQYNWA